MKGPIAEFLANDHRRLDELLQRAAADPRHVDPAAYDEFRAGLLRHIGMEEKILLPALSRLLGLPPHDEALKLRLDHGALAALLMPSPTPAILAAIRAILARHNAWEEGPGGLYASCDRIHVSEAASLAARLRAAPPVAVAPHSDRPAVMKTLRASLERAGYRLSDDGST